GLIEKKNEIFSLTRRGAFWIHLAQNHFMLDYINKVWTVSMNEPWPKKIEI
ncbi:radical SAM protein, partial [candidate division TA06 bacterium]